MYYGFKFTVLWILEHAKEWGLCGVSLFLMVHWLPIGKDKKQNW